MSTQYDIARQAMIDSQLKPNEVTEPGLLAAMQSIPRELFVPKSLRGVAYVDEDINIGGGRFLMEPITVARLLLNAGLTESSEVLVVGCGVGYLAAVASRLASAVVALEADADIAAKAEETLAACDVMNAAVVTGPFAEGFAKEGPYDVVVVDGAVADVPAAWLDQLKVGGKLLAVVNSGGVGRLTIYTKDQNGVGSRPLGDAHVAFLPGFEPKASFQF